MFSKDPQVPRETCWEERTEPALGEIGILGRGPGAPAGGQAGRPPVPVRRARGELRAPADFACNLEKGPSRVHLMGPWRIFWLNIAEGGERPSSYEL